MPDLDADRVIQLLSEKVAQGSVREVVQQVYSEQLEKQIASLQAQLRGEDDVAEGSHSQAARGANPA